MLKNFYAQSILETRKRNIRWTTQLSTEGHDAYEVCLRGELEEVYFRFYFINVLFS